MGKLTELLGSISPAQAGFIAPQPLDDGSVINVVDERPDPGISIVGHISLTVMFYAAFITYIVLASIQFANGTMPETNSMMPASQLPPVEVDVTLTCVSGTCGTLMVVENYTAYPGTSCARALPAAANGIRSRTVASGETVRAMLCYTGEDEWSVVTPGHLQVGMIQTIFSDLSGFGAVNVRSVADGGARLSRDLGLDKTSVRALNIGAEVRKVDDAIERVDVFPLQYQAEGFREGTNRSEILLQLVPLANVRTRESGRTLWQVIADIGSCFGTLQMVVIWIIPLWTLLFAVPPPKRRDTADKDAEEGKAGQTLEAELAELDAADKMLMPLGAMVSTETSYADDTDDMAGVKVQE